MHAEPAQYPNQGDRDTRSGFGQGLLELGEQDPSVVALAADLMSSVKMDAFQKAFPDRFFQCGIAEANMMGVAAGLATVGKRAFTGTFANFCTGRVYDQIRQSICYSRKNVKICASHAGLTLGEDGATHQILEDIGLMRMLPNMTVVVPCDYNQTRLATLHLGRHTGPAYLRYGRPKVPNFTPADDPDFALGRIQVLRQGTDLTLVACGHLVWHTLLAAETLAQEHGLQAEVLNAHTIKPFDEDTLLASAAKTGCVLTAEEHQKYGGLGELVAHVLAVHHPTPQTLVAVDDTFGESGKPHELLMKYGLGVDQVVKAALALRNRVG